MAIHQSTGANCAPSSPTFLVLDNNPVWTAELDGQWIATSDNTMFSCGRLTQQKRIAVQRGAIVRTVVGAGRYRILSCGSAPLELHLPIRRMRFDVELSNAIYRVARSDHAEHGC